MPGSATSCSYKHKATPSENVVSRPPPASCPSICIKWLLLPYYCHYSPITDQILLFPVTAKCLALCEIFRDD